MRRTGVESGRGRVLGPRTEARHEAVRAGSPAARTSLPPETVSAAPVPPALAAGTVTSRATPPATPWWVGRGQAAVIGALVVVTSLATALVVVQGARQIGSAPRQDTTPYLAVEPSAPLPLPERASTIEEPASGSDSRGPPPRPQVPVSEKDGTPAPAGAGKTGHHGTVQPLTPPARSPESAPARPDRDQPSAGDGPGGDGPSGIVELPEQRCHLALPPCAGAPGPPDSILHPGRSPRAGPPRAPPDHGGAAGRLTAPSGAPGHAGPL